MITENPIDTSTHTGPSLRQVTENVAGLQIEMVNLYFVSNPLSREWVLIDAGLPMSAGRIFRMAHELFGDRAPAAIVLTHGHFDHVGALHELVDRWDVPIYAHRLEMPYLTGRSAYPPPDPTVGGGMMARMSMLYPRHGYDFGQRMRELPEDGTVPHLPDWQWVPTPGHSPGHVSLFRQSDRVLIAGDAFVTQKQESMLAVLTNAQHVHGPPMYFTPDFVSAKHSVQTLAALEPSIAATGHGLPMSGDQLHAQLMALSLHFELLGMPAQGRYVNEPAVTDETGVRFVPPAVADPVPKIVAGIALSVIAMAAIKSLRQDRNHS